MYKDMYRTGHDDSNLISKDQICLYMYYYYNDDGYLLPYHHVLFVGTTIRQTINGNLEKNQKKKKKHG